MLNYIWSFMIIAGIMYGCLRGGVVASLMAEAALDSAGDAVELCIVMLGVVGMWNGIMNIARESGLIAKWTRGMNPVITFLFPGIPQGHPARDYIATNMIANILGLGWAATPAGLQAMKELAKLETERKKTTSKRTTSNKTVHRKTSETPETPETPEYPASNEMCTFLILNISSLQLIPINIIAYRSQYGSTNPTAIVGPAIMATAVSTLVAVVFCKIMTKIVK